MCKNTFFTKINDFFKLPFFTNKAYVASIWIIVAFVMSLKQYFTGSYNNYRIFEAGYHYNSSLNPTYLPGRYNHFSKPRRFFYDQKVLQIPASVSPIIRFPLFWLSFHNLPLFLYKWLCIKTLDKDKYLNLYFHPWEFIDLTDHTRFGFPAYVSKNSGPKMASRMDDFIQYMQSKKFEFATFQTFIETIVLKK